MDIAGRSVARYRYTARMEAFQAFSPLHAAVLLAIAASTAIAVMAARRSGIRRTDAPTAAERLVGFAYLAAWLTTYAFLLFPPLHDPARTYPFQLCHLAALTAALRLISGWQPLSAIVYFWGLGLCTQALVTPALSEGPALYPFWFFWTTHGLIAGVAFYDVLARGYRPSLRDCGLASAAAAGYLAVILPLNLGFGWNYGFVGPSRPEVPSIVDFLGSWPGRLVPIVAIVALAMGLLLLPWEIARRRARANPGTFSAAEPPTSSRGAHGR